MKQRTSKHGIDFLIDNEGMVPYAYNDSRGFATFGVGHLIAQRPVNTLDRIRYGTPRRPHRRQALRVFKRDLKKYEKAVRDAVGRELPKGKFDALVSFCFNIGIAGFASSTAARRVRAKAGSREVADAMLMWDQPPEIVPRREREARLYVRGWGHG